MTGPCAGKPRNTGKRISEAEFRRLWSDLTITVAEIGERLGICQTAVSSRAKTRGFPARPAGTSKPVCDPKALTRLWNDGVSISGIAKALGCHEKTVRNTRKRLGLPQRGAGRWKSTVSLDDYHAMQLRAAMAASARETEAAIDLCEMRDGRRTGGDGRRAA